MKKGTLALILIMLTCLVFVSCSNAKTEVASKDQTNADTVKEIKEYKIGLVLPLTGDTSFWGIRCKEAAQLAADKINAEGGINGANLVIDPQDTRGQKSEVANVVQRFASDTSYIAIGGSVLSGDMFVGGPIANNAGIVMCGFATTATGIPEIGDYIFRIATTGEVGTPAMMAYAKEKYNLKSVAILSSINNDYSVGARNDFINGAKQLELEVVADETYSDGDNNFSAQISKIVAAKPDALIFAGYATEGSLAAIEARKQGLTIPFMGGDGMIDAENLSKIGGEATEGMLCFGGYNAGYDNPISKDFVKNFTDKYGHEPESAAAGAYDAVMMMANALKKSGPDRSAFRDVFAVSKDYEGVSGKISFDENREVVKTTFIFEYKDKTFNLIEAR